MMKLNQKAIAASLGELIKERDDLQAQVSTLTRQLAEAHKRETDAYDEIFNYVPEANDDNGEPLTVAGKIKRLDQFAMFIEARGMERAAEIVAGWDVGHDSASRSIVLTLRAEAKKIREGKV